MEPIASQRSPDALIVGAGPTGLVLACELIRHGLKCRIIDRLPSPSPWSRAIGIQARTLETFDILGITHEFISQGWKVRGMSAFAEGKRIVHLRFDDLDTPYPFLLMLPQDQTENILSKHLKASGVEVERGIELKSFRHEVGHVTAILQAVDNNEETETITSWLFGCDGAHSTVRHLLNLPFEGSDYSETFLLADLDLNWSLPPDEIILSFSPSGLIGIFPMGGSRYRFIADIPPGFPADASAVPALPEFQTLFDARSPAAGKLSELRWASVFHLHRRQVTRLREGRVFVAGDAAHIHSPAGGQGMNTGIQDAVNLAWKVGIVQKGGGSTALLDSYERERYPVAQEVLRESDFLIRMATLQNPIQKYLRNHLAPLLTHIRLLRPRLEQNIAELNIQYRSSPMVEEHALLTGPQAGERAPDGRVKLVATGEDTRILPLLARHRFILLLFQGSREAKKESLQNLAESSKMVEVRYKDSIAAYSVVIDSTRIAEGESAVLHDVNGALHARYGAELPCLYLIRPDGYIGFRGSAEEHRHFAAYLDRTLALPTCS